MNLVIDIGNSTLKAAVFSNGVLKKHIHAEETEWEESLTGLCASKKVERVLICAVCDIPQRLMDYIESLGAQAHILNAETKLPFINDYRSPKTLGADRVAAVAGAMMKWPEKNVLVVDVGSCVTYDVLDNEGHYKGGLIAPGYRMRLLSMHEHTARLPLVEPYGPLPVIGYDTETALRAGALRGIGYEIIGFYNELKPKMAGPVNLVLTGGDAPLVKEISGMRAKEDDLLVLRGLDYILRYNEDKN